MAEQQIAREVREISDLQFRMEMLRSEQNATQQRIDVEDQKLKTERLNMPDVNETTGRRKSTRLSMADLGVNLSETAPELNLEELLQNEKMVEETLSQKDNMLNMLNDTKMQVEALAPGAKFATGNRILTIKQKITIHVHFVIHINLLCL